MAWILFNLFILLMILIDLRLHSNKDGTMSAREALYWSCFWIALALLFNLGIYYFSGTQAALEFLSGYLIEKSLSLDNLFVFLLIFGYFKTPEEQFHRILFWGVVGAIVMRALFIFGGIALITHFHWLLYLFGFLLLIMGLRMLRKDDEEIHPENNPLLLLLKKLMPITSDYRGKHFVVKEAGRYFATPLLVTLVAIESADLIFAVDSIPAILAITLDPFIVYTSNIFAILGLRALFFALAASIKLFHHLHYALGAILMFVGVKMLIAPWYKVPITATLAFIVLAVVVTLIMSKFQKA